MPSPIDSIVQDIYQSYDGSDEEKFQEVTKFLHNLQNQREEHYNKIVPKLDKIISGMDQLKDNTAKQKTLLEVKDIIISQDNNINQKLDQIITNLIELMNKVNVCSSLQGQQIRPTQYSKSKIFAGKKIFVRRHKDTANQSSVQGGTHLVSVLKITNIETKKLSKNHCRYSCLQIG